MKNIYRIGSRWSREFFIARSIEEAIAKYKKANRKLDPEDTEITRVEYLGELTG